jgi:glycosyltransferase involved in cell wall biosynthesis
MPALSVVAPAFNQAGTIASTLREIVRRLDARGLDFELIVVSDGSRDGTFDAARGVEAEDARVRVIDYDRNLGKGFAVRTGSRAARGEWVAWIDSDLDLDPSRVAEFLDRARADDLDVVVGSKRHPESDVAYPRRRRVYSWLYQMLVRALFSLDVRDTQVGMKLFRREVLEDVLPVVLVKRYAFDLEVLAVARHFGHTRIVESPITLEYRFTGSGVGWRAIVNALWDTAAVFYRLRIRRHYDRQRHFVGGLRNDTEPLNPRLTVVTAPAELDDAGTRRMEALARSLAPGSRVVVVTERMNGASPQPPGVTVIATQERRESERLRIGAALAHTDLVALLGDDARPSGGWAVAATSLLSDQGVAAVVGPTVPRLGADLRCDAAGILTESRLGVGRARSRSSIGPMQQVDEFPLSNLVTRRALLDETIDAGAELDDDLCGEIRRRSGQLTIFSPDAVVTTLPSRLFGPYLRRIHGIGIDRGSSVSDGRAIGTRHAAPVALLLVAALGVPAALLGGAWLLAWMAVMATYAVALSGLGVLTFLLHRRAALSLLVVAGAATSHVAFAAGLLRGLVRRRRTREAPESELSPSSG